jgi:cytochrome c2
MWSSSAHGRAMEDEVFLEAYRETKAGEGEEVSRQCLACHAPLTGVNSDWALAQKVTWEGVHCDVCHGMVAVDMTGANPKPVLDIGKVKRGPIKDAASSAHEVAFSELHATALACAPCHEGSTADGVKVITTYSEYAASAAAKDGKTCQTCHMGKTKANVVDPKIARVAAAEVNLHEVPGGHSLEQLHKALQVALDPKRVGDSLCVTVRLTNKGAGHAVPTGMPGRRVILELAVRSGTGEAFEDKRIYTKTFADRNGATITSDSKYFTKGLKLETDTRIQADERRTETFSFPVPASATAHVTLKLHYEHAPMGGPENRTWLTFYTENRTLPPGGR